MSTLKLWGGHECTVNRVGDSFSDQTVRSGHETRIEDLELFARIGLAALRYPVLWERIAPRRPDERDFSWTDERLTRIRDLGMTPIAGLCHHGAGPAYTNLLDEGFAPGLAAHARAVAERYPWLTDYTPVNEPLTTARFSALYGFWHPHTRDETACWLALLNEIDATRLSMREIRRVNPAARLIQTEDLGHTHGTPACAAQVEYENHRRWLTWDLLCGRVTPGHPMHDRLAAHGFEDRLKAIADDPCPPDVIGVNHYLSSERFLDERLELYPSRLHGGNGEVAYADIEAVRVAEEPVGLEALLAETWKRYGITLAVTESHNGCTREEQARWLYEGWVACERLRRDGVDVEALTAWSLIGSIDWVTLLTERRDHYECGVFDLRGRTPRPTAMVPMLSALARGETPPALPLSGPGWWRRPTRLTHPKSHRVVPTGVARRVTPVQTLPCGPILITGATGTLGRALARDCETRGLPFLLTNRRMMDLCDRDAIRATLKAVRPSAVVNAAGFVRVDEAESGEDDCRRANADGPAWLAEACRKADVPLVVFSSDLVFDGAKGAPYVESDRPSPLNAYGRSKAEMERRVADSGARALIVRTSAFFSPHDVYNFAHDVVETLARGERFRAADDLAVSPTYVPDLTHAVLDLLIDGETGLWHLANQGRATWADFARHVAARAGFDPLDVEGVPHAAFYWAAPRPADVTLDSERGRMLGRFEAAVDRFVGHREDREGVSRDLCAPDLVEIDDDSVEAAE